MGFVSTEILELRAKISIFAEIIILMIICFICIQHLTEMNLEWLENFQAHIIALIGEKPTS